MSFLAQLPRIPPVVADRPPPDVAHLRTHACPHITRSSIRIRWESDWALDAANGDGLGGRPTDSTDEALLDSHGEVQGVADRCLVLGGAGRGNRGNCESLVSGDQRQNRTDPHVGSLELP